MPACFAELGGVRSNVQCVPDQGRGSCNRVQHLGSRGWPSWGGGKRQVCKEQAPCRLLWSGRRWHGADGHRTGALGYSHMLTLTSRPCCPIPGGPGSP